MNIPASSVVSSRLQNMRRRFEGQRNATAHKLNNNRLKQITFHALRHLRATMEYHRTNFKARVISFEKPQPATSMDYRYLFLLFH